MEPKNNGENQQLFKEVKEIHIEKENEELPKEIKQFFEQSQKLFDFIKKGKGKIYIKNKDKLNIKIKGKSFCKIFGQSSLITKSRSYVVTNETTVEVGISNELLDDSNENILEIIENKNEFPVTMAKDMNIENEEKIKKQIVLKNKSIKNILSKIGTIKDNFTFIQLSLTQVSFDYSTKKLQYLINKYNFLLDSKKIFYIVYKSKNEEEEENEEEEDELEKYAVSYYSIKKIMDLTEKDENQKDKYLSLILTNKDTENYEKENSLYLNNLTNSGENMLIFKKFKKNEEKYIKDILEKNVQIKRMKKVENKEMNQCFDIVEEVLKKDKDEDDKKENKDNKKDNIEENKDNKKEIIEENKDNNINNKEKLQRIENKKKEIDEAINNRKNRFIEIMHNNKDKKYINLQYLDLMEEFNKKNSKYKIDYYLVKNDRFKDVEIPTECINNYIRYKTEYEKKQFVLVNLNNNENEVQYLVGLNDLKKLYNDWIDLEQEQIINTENPQFEGKKIDLDKSNIVKIGEIKELPQQPDLFKKMKEEEEIKKEIDLESSQIYGNYPDIYKNIDDKKYIVITRVIKKKKKKKKEKK